MKFVAKKDRVKHLNNKFCVAYEYPTGDKEINGAVIELSGRYPDKGRVVNEVCKELVQIVKGEGMLNVDGREVLLKEGDQVLIEQGERYYFDGKMTLFVPCAPAWYPAQHKEVKK
ncbi:hypothetical protein A2714_02530 [Candidatus Woesebacteria bacterium RIFCSPHIGHO2_01_FULL_38_9]|uniref:Cupin 2 conserved barrel domain-containing protein n=2 Tax=Candidatus Woeseibacteriota TaxID=1752722 RepID=A0A1F7Y379_9BACT|nr:MAG: hypothetical protein A2714_02530 [Candidatus Woesebacteria bacterium RIFCSPHIGHO2_01_FULL_38_9]OGM60553.1 MAG: hypothetical protein A3A75_03450 [Candidatus Woesebacteria bacterium RIFCSPLOWO2_01_FULL_39_10]